MFNDVLILLNCPPGLIQVCLRFRGKLGRIDEESSGVRSNYRVGEENYMKVSLNGQPHRLNIRERTRVIINIRAPHPN
jgi:hypothetical protein